MFLFRLYRSSENGTDQNLLKEKKRSRAEKLSRLPSTMTNDKGTTSYKRASSSITLAPMVHRKAYDPPLALMHRRGSDASSQRFDRETEADIKAVRALT